MRYKKLLAKLGIILILATVATPAMMTAPAMASGQYISIHPDHGPVGTEVRIVGTSFTPSVVTSNTTTTFAKTYFPDKTVLVKLTAIDTWGNFETSFFVSQYPVGQYKVWVYDGSASPPKWISANFRLVPEIKLSKSSGYVGDKITVNGTGFAATSNTTVYFDGSEVAAAITNQHGSFATANITIPASNNGSHSIKAVDTSSNNSTCQFSIKQQMTISPTSGLIDEEVTISGTGFASSRPITVTFNNNILATRPELIKTSHNGNFTGKFFVPTSSINTYIVEVSDGSNRVDTTFSVVLGGKMNRIIGYAGSDVIFSGTGFIPNRIAIIYYDTTQVAEATVDADGNFSASFNIPASLGGEHTVSATDGTNTAEVTFTMESTVPPAPSPLLPANASTVEPETRFAWESVTDPSGVTYTLQIASDTSSTSANSTSANSTSANSTSTNSTSANSTSLVLEKSKLTATQYTLTPEEKLELTNKETPYYWRVRAIDNASNAGDWSTTREFYVGVSGTPAAEMTRIIGYAGSDVTFSGTGFIPNRIAIIYYDTTQVAEATVDADGNFSASFNIPASLGGEHTVSATDGTNTAEVTFTMESTVPPAPSPLLPANASTAEPETHFAWESVTDPSGVTYTLQIASDTSFTSANSTFTSANSTSLMLEKSKLAATQYTLTPEEKLEPTKKETPYYWRVRAIDNASNAGDWSTAREFYVGASGTLMAPWLLYSLIAEGGTFTCLFGYWLVRKKVKSRAGIFSAGLNPLEDGK